MKYFRRFLLALLACIALAGVPAVQAQTTPTPTPPKVLVLFDMPSGTPWDKLGLAYAVMLQNLLGHFQAQVDLLPVAQYSAGKVENYNATFYMGSDYDHPIPASFLADVSSTAKTVVWFKYNLWQLAWNPAYNFTARTGLNYVDLLGMNAAPSSGNPNPGFYDTVRYKGLDFVKFYQYDAGHNTINADPDIGHVAIADTTKAQRLVNISNPQLAKSVPYITRSGNFWYVADLPFSFIGPRDRYLVFADLLHDMMGSTHAFYHKAMVRLEDVGALVSVQTMKDLSDYLSAKAIPFSVAVIPRYEDPLGTYNDGVPEEVLLSAASNLRTSVNYARQRGAELVMHGFTHQYGSMRNPHTGVSGDDYEFWNIVDNKPVQEDSISWAFGRLNTGLSDMRAFNWNPVAWEAPHYQTSPLAARTAPMLFSKTYQRAVYYTSDKPDLFAAQNRDFAVGQFFPYPIASDLYGQYIIPENLGNIEYDIHTIDPTSNFNYTPDDIILNAKYAKTIRDGVASFFFHPFWLEPELGVPGMADFQRTIDGITALGFTWIAPSKLRGPAP